MTTTRRTITIIAATCLLLALAGCTTQLASSPTEAPTTQLQTFPTEATPPARAPTVPPPTQPPAPTAFTGYFAIEGKWKNVGEGTFGQMQKGAVVIFDGMNCNVFSPNDTYAFYEESGRYRLDVTGLLGGNPSFTVVPVDENNCELYYGSTVIALRRVG